MNAQFLGGLLLLAIIVVPTNAQPDAVAKVMLYARVTGPLEKVHVKPGAAVKKGELLFEIDSTVLRAELERATADYAHAEAKLQLHAIEFARAQRLFEVKAISREEFDKFAGDRSIAQANVGVVRTHLTLAKVRMEFTKVHAPIDGTLLRPLQNIGSLVKGDETLLAEIVQGPIKTSMAIRELQKERHAALAKAAELTSAQHKAGAAPTSAVLRAQRVALDAALDLCDTPAERVELLRKDLKLAEHLFQLLEAQREAGQVQETELLQARAAKLEARIRLLREEEKVGPQLNR